MRTTPIPDRAKHLPVTARRRPRRLRAFAESASGGASCPSVS